MNGPLCLAESLEYEGQFAKDKYGAYEGCRCLDCVLIRQEAKKHDTEL